MKYYYGTNYKEAMSNEPVEISSVETLEKYREHYQVVIPANQVENDYNIALEEDAYELDTSKGTLKIDKQIFDDFVKDSVIKILFVDEDDALFEYKMISEDEEYIYLEYFGD